MSDSIDRVFVKAITTIRALSSRSNYGSLPRPPAEKRIKLYGLYKQAVEGDVENVMPRPIGFTLEDEGAKKKWDAWKREQGLSRTEAKRQYISFLIETMRIYASGTLEARELLSELEYLWDQIKDLQFVEDDSISPNNYPFPTHSPLFSQSDRYSTVTPLPLPSNYSASIVGGQTGGGGGSVLQQYKTNLQKIYSHSRRSTMLSINEYVQQQRQQSQLLHGHQSNQHIAPTAYSLNDNSPAIAPNQTVPSNFTVPDELRAWQGEMTTIINKLSREFLNSKAQKSKYGRGIHSDDEDDIENPNERLRRRALHILKLVGFNLLTFLKNFSISLLAILFITWCIKKNVLVKRTIVNQPVSNNRTKKELVINMVLNMDENKWFVRLLSFIDSFVGFV